MASLLVTGGAGFIGSNFVYHHHAVKPSDTIVVLDALTYAGCRETLDAVVDDKSVIFVKGSILDADLVRELMERYSIDTVVHFAAESHVDRSIVGPDAFIKTNIEGTYTLLKAARERFTEKKLGGHFHHISTDEVFGTLSPDDHPFTEENPYRPNSPYAASKASSDCLVRAFVHTYGLEATVTNCSNNYGPRQFPEKLMPLAITNLLDGKSVPIYGDGAQIRDWLYVEDHCRAIEMCLERGESGRTYNIGGRAEKTNLEVVRTLCRAVDAAFAADPSLKERYPDCPAARGVSTLESLVHVQDRPGHDRRYAIDPSFAEGALGFKPAQSFESGMADTVHWYLENEAWWRMLKGRRIDFTGGWSTIKAQTGLEKDSR